MARDTPHGDDATGAPPHDDATADHMVLCTDLSENNTLPHMTKT